MYPADDLLLRVALTRSATREMLEAARRTLNESRALTERMRARLAAARHPAPPAVPSGPAPPDRPPR